MPTIKELDELLLADLRSNSGQSSWDWPADLRYARLLGLSEEAKVIEDAINSQAVAYSRCYAIEKTGVTKKRLGNLQRLVREGRARAFWRGLGPGAALLCSARRVRVYEAVEGGAGEKN